jgi:hypothetical protein
MRGSGLGIRRDWEVHLDQVLVLMRDVAGRTCHFQSVLWAASAIFQMHDTWHILMLQRTVAVFFAWRRAGDCWGMM